MYEFDVEGRDRGTQKHGTLKPLPFANGIFPQTLSDFGTASALQQNCQ